LKLVTGPANSGKAGEIMRAYRARLAEEPILVVPALRDVDHTLRELAAAGAVLGANVVRFARLFEIVAERCDGAPVRRASRLQREAIAEEAVASMRLRRLARSARGAGFPRAVIRFVAELERAMVEPQELERALERWGRARGRAAEAAAIYRRYRERLDAAGLIDAELFAWRALAALRARPDRFGATPVFLYGFDDFTPIELGTIETLATAAAAPVALSLPYERGRAAFKAIAPLFERLATVADEHVELEPTTDHYRPEARAPLAHIERSLYGADPRRAAADGAVTLLSAGGARAEVELVAANVLRLLRAGTAAGDVAVVFRDPARYASLVEQVFGAYGIPFSLERRVPLAHTALGRGLLALLRCAAPGAEAADLIAYLRTPGLLEYPRLADRLEADARRAGAHTVAEARALWEERRAWRLDEIDRLRRARAGEPLLLELDRELDRLLARAYRRAAPVFSQTQADDPRVVETVHSAVRELHRLVGAGGRALDARGLHDKLARLQVEFGERARPDRVQVATPEAVRARRFDAVFVCGLQAGEFPRAEPADPFLPDDDRRAIAAAGGLVLPAREATADRERHLFYVCASRAERALYLSFRFADEQGNPQVPSFLIEEVTDLFDESLPAGARRRSLSDVTWPLADAPTEAEWRRSLALAAGGGDEPEPTGLSHPNRLAELQGERGYSAGALETFADCPVKWLVDRVLRPDELEPDPEPLVRGSYAHAVLEQTYRRLREETGSARVTHANLERTERLLIETLADNRRRFRISPREARFRTATRRLEFDLLRHLRREADSDGDFEPRELELSFGLADDGHPPLRLEPEGVSIRGRVDRVDVHDGEAVVLDYKSGKRVYPVARWEHDNRLQVALYMLAVRELLGLDPVGGLYVPLAGADARPRGLVRSDRADALGRACVRTDMREGDEFERELHAARARVCELADRMRAGDVRPCPDTCAWNGGCSYPSICRVER
jgi:ATP-dependent helicase/DNAse subunit B